MYKEDTIAAIATPLGSAAIGKIRVSGFRAVEIADKVFESIKGKTLREVPAYTAHYGHVVDPDDDRIIDEVIVLLMRGPHSFTGEDVVEFDCHGGMLPLRKVLELLLRNGARLAEPGEFSRRAFLNGRLDLAQAEGIMEIINSQTDKALAAAVDHLRGRLSADVKKIGDRVSGLLAHLEAAIDFPEDEIDGFEVSELSSRVQEIRSDIEKLLKTAKQGKLLREGITAVIAGKPNVGKSSLLNALLEEERAIVTEVPGTTRDVIEESISVSGIPVRLIDTAGIRRTEDEVEKIGVERSREYLERADLLFFLLDVDQGITCEDREIYSLIKDRPLITVVNKSDLQNDIDLNSIKENFPGHPLHLISVKERKGLGKLRDTVADIISAGGLIPGDDVLITRTRHKKALEEALEAICRVEASLGKGLPYDFLTIDLNECLECLGRITGETMDEDILDRIFSDFCLGK
ncbi:MAG: tRNA uridine-5-carboxymethylaminomethyl(34) synthesis GTPase MnmE [Halanaerobiaceae bacterium]